MAQDGDTVIPVAVGDVATRSKVHARVDTAVRDLKQGFSFLSESNLESVTLAWLTDANYGPGAQTPTSNTTPNASAGAVVPIVKNRLVWLLVFSHFSMPVFGPYHGPTITTSPIQDGGKGRMWVAVDAVTGRMLIARSIDSGGH
jgi:hypothetical protein